MSYLACYTCTISDQKLQQLPLFGEGGNVWREEANPSCIPFYRLRAFARLSLQGFLQKRKVAPRASTSAPGAAGEDWLWGPLQNLVGVKGQKNLRQRGPSPIRGGCSPSPTIRGKVAATVCTFSFKLTSGLGWARMEQGNPRVQLAVLEFVHVKTKSPSKWSKKKKRIL